jgi:hypothetical protein
MTFFTPRIIPHPALVPGLQSAIRNPQSAIRNPQL